MADCSMSAEEESVGRAVRALSVGRARDSRGQLQTEASNNPLDTLSTLTPQHPHRPPLTTPQHSRKWGWWEMGQMVGG